MIEVFPKQDSRQGFGNLVKLPLGIHQKTRRRCLFVNRSFQPLPDQWEALARVRAVTPEQLRLFLSENNVAVPEKRIAKEIDPENPPYPCLSSMLKEGVSEGTRDTAAFNIACFFSRVGIPGDIAETALLEWNKRNSPPLHPADVSRKILSAYSKLYSPNPCKYHEFDQYCDQSCVMYEYKKRIRGLV
jgi:hypothetical protein